MSESLRPLDLRSAPPARLRTRKRADDGPWLSEDEQRAWRTFLRMLTELSIRQASLLQEAGISMADYGVLAVLCEAPGGCMVAKELRRELRWEKSRLAHQVRRMEQRGQITRHDCADDERSVMVAITDAGRATIERAAPEHVKQVRDLFIDAMTPEQLEALRDASEAVLERMQQRDAEM